PITSVAINRRGGMLRKHTPGRVSRIDVVWENSMSSVKHFYRPRSVSRAYWPRQSDRRAIIYRPFDDGRPSSAIGAQRRRPSAVRQSVLRAGTHVAYLAGHAFPNLLLAAGSWVVAEVLAGCATYAEAMYCIPPGMLDHEGADECAASGPSLPG